MRTAASRCLREWGKSDVEMASVWAREYAGPGDPDYFYARSKRGSHRVHKVNPEAAQQWVNSIANDGARGRAEQILDGIKGR